MRASQLVRHGKMGRVICVEFDNIVAYFLRDHSPL
jgi:hypothetical protein